MQVIGFDQRERLADAGRNLVCRHAQVLESEGHVAIDGRSHGVGLGILKHAAHDRRQLGRLSHPGVISPHDDATGEPPAMKMRYQPGQRAQQRGFAAARGALDHHDLAGRDLQADIVERGPVGASGPKRQ